MTKQEFEALAGYEVSFDDYTKVIEPMYMACDLNKQEFVSCISKERFAIKTEKELIAILRKEAKHLADICGHHDDLESEKRYLNTVTELENRFGGAWCTFYGYEYGDRGCKYPQRIVKYVYGNAVKSIKLVA